jgi:hypothetical protein
MIEGRPVCKRFVWHRFVRRSCRRLVTKDGYCALHHPDAKAARDARRAAKYEAANAKIRENLRMVALEQAKLRRIRLRSAAMVKLLRRLVRDYDGKKKPPIPRRVFFDDVCELLKEIDGE